MACASTWTQIQTPAWGRRAANGLRTASGRCRNLRCSAVYRARGTPRQRFRTRAPEQHRIVAVCHFRNPKYSRSRSRRRIQGDQRPRSETCPNPHIGSSRYSARCDTQATPREQQYGSGRRLERVRGRLAAVASAVQTLAREINDTVCCGPPMQMQQQYLGRSWLTSAALRDFAQIVANRPWQLRAVDRVPDDHCRRCNRTPAFSGGR